VLIPSIDLMGGRIVQLEQGERLRVASDDIDGWVRRFSSFPIVQLIDLDAAVGRGDNAALVRSLCRALPCQVGGGVRTVERARDVLNAGARRVIVGSALFTATGVNTDAAAAFAKAIPADALIGAVDSRGGRVVIHGWQTTVPVSAAEAVRALEPHVGAFLYTHVDTEGLLLGLDIPAVEAVAAATSRPVIAAGGIRSRDEIDTLHARGIDAVVGMAIYQGVVDTESYQTQDSRQGMRRAPGPS
jgi:phosphoribosylformimino-5-aminoimidazole carboxamide ribotide isomerase